MEMFKPKFSVEINIISRGKSHTVKSKAVVEEIIMVIYEVVFYDKNNIG